MGMRVNAELPLPADLKNEYPLSDKIKAIKAKRDEEIRDIFTGKSDKFVVIIGPCSADNEDSVCEYVNRLAKLNDRVSDKLMIIPRIYTNKPRTTGEGYKGMLHQPDPEQAPDLLAGIIAIRKMHLRAMQETYLTAAVLSSGSAITEITFAGLSYIIQHHQSFRKQRCIHRTHR